MPNKQLETSPPFGSIPHRNRDWIWTFRVHNLQNFEAFQLSTNPRTKPSLPNISKNPSAFIFPKTIISPPL